MRTDFLQLVRGAADFSVSAVRFKMVRQHSLPVRFLPSMNGVPMPVFDHVRTRREVRINVQAELSVVGRELALGVPADGLGVGLGDQIVGLLQGTREIARQGGTDAVEIIMTTVIRIQRYEVTAPSAL